MFSATAIADFLACNHLTALNRARVEGEIRKPFFPDPGLELLKKLGLAHEETYLRHLSDDRGLEISKIPDDIPWKEAAAQTVEAIKRGAEVIYQATFITGQWHGRADFLVRVDKPGDLGAWSYEVVETKLARSTKARAIIQLCFYSDLLSGIQGVEPDYMHVVLGRGAGPERFFVQRYLAYFRKVRREFEEAYRARASTYPEPVELCRVCDWSSVCDQRWRQDDHLSLVAGITRNQRKELVENRVTTVAELGRLPVQPSFLRIGDQALLRIREQARLQVEGREKGHHVYELAPVEAEKGLCSLPSPSPGDVFLDFEGDPFAFEQGLEYLFGVVSKGNFGLRISDCGFESKELREGDFGLGIADFGFESKELREGDFGLGISDCGFESKEGTDSEIRYEATWAFDRAEEKKAFEKFIASVMERWRQYPDMHIYHYGAYEETAIKRMAGQHATCVDEVDQLLRGDVLVDLYRTVRQGLQASVESYSIKKLEPLYEFTREVRLIDANLALTTFQAMLAFGPGKENLGENFGEVLKAIEGYNRDDCMSTMRLRDWLEEKRTELETTTGVQLPRPAAKESAPNEDLSAYLERVRVVADRLTSDLPASETEWTEEQRGRRLLAQLLEWHRREDKSAWWEYFRRCELTDEELQRDKSSLGGLVYCGPVDMIKKSIVHRYQFPLQDHAIDRARSAHDPRTQKGVGEIVALDKRALTIDIKRGTASTVPHPTALIPDEIVGSKVQRESLLQLGSWVVENGIDGLGSFQAARDLLLRTPPRMRAEFFATGGTTVQRHAGDEAMTTTGAHGGTPLQCGDRQLVDVARQLAVALDNCVLPIQGPPGSGKTYTGARMVVELVKQNKRVGITAVSHKVISKLLEEVCAAAREANVDLQAIQKVDSGDGCQDPVVDCTNSNEEIVAALTNRTAQVAAGTVWLWSRDDMAGAVDVLFVDEAGQMSLANVLAASKAAASVVLLGDPQQLDQPQRGVHPPGAEASALSHLLNGRATIGEDQGLFLSESWRLHPDVCKFTSEVFYDGRLLSRPENERQRLNTEVPLGGTGLRFAPVNHSGNQSESPEEVARVAELVESLLRHQATWTNKKGEVRALTLEDILIVAPYNAQVSALLQTLPSGARVGTVDKFQGQEAPVVFYSMTTSTPEDAPRGMEFLYSSNRLNVATSRAQCVTVLVASPALFDVECKTPRQIELANAFCRYLELAQMV